MRRFFIFISYSLFAFCAHTQTQEIPYTLQDRERLIRVEERLDALNAKVDSNTAALETKMDIKFDSQQRQLDDIKTLFYWGFGILITLFVFMLGYMIWDRRTALKPALDASREAEDKTKTFFVVLREYASKNPELAEIMRMHGLL